MSVINTSVVVFAKGKSYNEGVDNSLSLRGLMSQYKWCVPGLRPNRLWCYPMTLLLFSSIERFNGKETNIYCSLCVLIVFL